MYRGKVAVIAGGASGIGRALAAELAGRGAAVIVANRAGRSLEAFRSQSRLASYEADMTQPAQVEELVRRVAGRYGSIDYFFNCVGIVQGGEAHDTPLDVVEDVIRTNVDAIAYGTHYVYQQMVRQGSGHIVNLSSAAGLLPTPLMSYYTFSKYGIVGFCHALRAEAADIGVRVSVVCPGFVKTPIYQKSHYNQIDKGKTIDLLFRRLPIQTPEAAARRIIRGVSRNQATIHTWFATRPVWWLYRLTPDGYIWLIGQAVKIARQRLELPDGR
jgi:short-subunit dehydrogenase